VQRLNQVLLLFVFSINFGDIFNFYHIKTYRKILDKSKKIFVQQHFIFCLFNKIEDIKNKCAKMR